MLSPENLTRREFLKLSVVGVSTAIGLTVGSFEVSEISYQIEKIFYSPKSYDASIFFAKLLDKGKDKWQVGSGVLLDSYNILTAAHNKIDHDFSYTPNKEIRETYSSNQQVLGNIVRAVRHPSLDIAIVHLNNPEKDRQFPRVKKNPVRPGSGPLTLSAARNLRIEEVFAGYVSEITDHDEFGQRKPKGSMLVINNSAASPGDSGSPLFFDETEELIGICIGEARSYVMGLFQRSYYINLTLPEIYNWISVNTK